VGKEKKARSGKYFCVMLTLQLVFAIGLFIYAILKSTILKNESSNLGVVIILSMFLDGSISIVFLVFTIINFILSFRFKNSGGTAIRLLSILVFVLGLALAAVLIVFAILPFALFIMFGWIMALAQHNNGPNFIENLFLNKWGTYLSLGISTACVVVLTIMVVIAWMKCRTIPPTQAVSK